VKPYYQHGGVTIYHADCREILPTIPPHEVGLLLTDPPFGVGEKTNRRSRGRGVGGNPGAGLHAGAYKARDFAPIAGDDRPFDPSHLLAYRAVIFGAIHFAALLPPSPTWLVWDKRDGVGSDDNADCEIAWSNLGGPARLFRHLWRGLCRATETGADHLHPTQKPVALASWILNRWTARGDLVVDPYMGSGFAAVAAKENGRRFIGVELEEAYCEITARRLAQDVLPLG
jgi:site-specific DNA-methyltransferase (adenine-specific)